MKIEVRDRGLRIRDGGLTTEVEYVSLRMEQLRLMIENGVLRIVFWENCSALPSYLVDIDPPSPPKKVQLEFF